MTTTPDSEALWQPSEARIDAAQITAFQRWLHKEYGHTFSHYDALWQWSASHQEEFWAAVWRYFDIQASCTSPGSFRGPGCPMRTGSRAPN